MVSIKTSEQIREKCHMNKIKRDQKKDLRIEMAAGLYIWGFPLVVMHRTRALHCSRDGPGRLQHRLELSTARDRTVVGPNNDTLYSSGWYDLSKGDLGLQVPPMDHPNRYWSVMLLDAYTQVTYVSRRQYGVEGTSVRLTYDPRKEHDHSRRADLSLLAPPRSGCWFGRWSRDPMTWNRPGQCRKVSR